jgi:Ca2+:H+ antiporter
MNANHFYVIAALRPQMNKAGGRTRSFRLAPSETTPLLTNGESHQHIRHFWGDGDDNLWRAKPKRWLHMSWLTLASNYVNVLLVFVPAGIVVGALKMNPLLVFVLNFLAIIPLASLLSFATEELSAEMGQTIGGLMNASFGNAVELIVCDGLELFVHSFLFLIE